MRDQPSLLKSARSLRRRRAQVAEIIVTRQLKAMHLAAQVERMAALQQVAHAGMLAIGRAEYLLRLERAIGFPAVLDIEDGEDDAFLIAQGDLFRVAHCLGEFLVDVERDRHRPQVAVGQAHRVAHGFVIVAPHEAAQRRERACQQHFQVAQLARGQVPRGQCRSLALERFDFGGRDEAINEVATMRCDQLGHRVSW